MRQHEMTSTLKNCLGTDISDVMFTDENTIIFNASLNQYDKRRFESYSNLVEVDLVDECLNSAVCRTTLSCIERMGKIRHIAANE